MVTIRRLIAEYVDYAKTLYAPKTAQTYHDRTKLLSDLYGNLPVNKLTHKFVTKYIGEASISRRSGRTMATATTRSTIAVTERLIRFGVSLGYLKKPVHLDIRLPKDKLRERIPTRDEQATVLRLASRPFRLIFQAMRYSGARPNELATADIEDYDKRRKLIVLAEHKDMRRSGRVRKIGVGKRLARLLRYAIGKRTSGPIFLNSHGCRWSSENVSHHYGRLRDRADLSKDLCLYAATRHEFGTRTTKKYGIFVAAKCLGHHDIKSTLRYSHMDDSELADYQDGL